MTMQSIVRYFVVMAAFCTTSPVPTIAKEMEFIYRISGDDYVCGRMCPDYIEADGEITPDTPRQFERYVKASSIDGTFEGALIYLISPGGNLGAAIELGLLFRRHKMIVGIGKSILEECDEEAKKGLRERYSRFPNFDPLSEDMNYQRVVDESTGICYSACFYAFIGGIERSVGDGSRLGIHRFFTKDAVSDLTARKFTSFDLSRQQSVTAMVSEYVVRMGIDPQVVTLASTVGHDQVYILSKADQARFKIVLNQPVSSGFSGWTLDEFQDGLMVLGTHLERDNYRQTYIKHSVSFGCKQSPAPQIYLATSFDIDGQKGDKDSIFGVVLHFDGAEIDLDKHYYGYEKFGGNDGVGVVTRFEAKSLLDLLEMTNIFTVEFYLPSYLGAIQKSSFPIDDLEKKIKLVVRNCIK